MNEYIFCEFLIEDVDTELTTGLHDILESIGEDFLVISRYRWIDDEDGEYLKISGRLNSRYATILKLQYPELAKRMRISYIPDEMKNKYRQK